MVDDWSIDGSPPHQSKTGGAAHHEPRGVPVLEDEQAARGAPGHPTGPCCFGVRLTGDCREGLGGSIRRIVATSQSIHQPTHPQLNTGPNPAPGLQVRHLRGRALQALGGPGHPARRVHRGVPRPARRRARPGRCARTHVTTCSQSLTRSVFAALGAPPTLLSKLTRYHAHPVSRR